ncbi:MAG: TIGR00282 family metallophosphoesterase [Peptococcaceae bacterium]|nr:TIGR00282 family metallophosphoesterase [Peptococcaceae bacterium]
MKILFIGDMVTPDSIEMASRCIRQLKKEQTIDLIIANGENIHTQNGLNLKQYQQLKNIGIDVVTLGNHAWNQPQIYHFIDENEDIVRPFNFPPDTPGRGWTVAEAHHRSVAVVVAMGNVYVSTLTSPFQDIMKVVDNLHEEGVKTIIVDMHAEATSEKLALARYLDGKVSAVLGTHTHIPTADEQILPKGTAYQTDVGMVGPVDSVIGMKVEASINRFLTQRRVKFQQSEDNHFLFQAVLVEINNDGRAVQIERIEKRMTIERTRV